MPLLVGLRRAFARAQMLPPLVVDVLLALGFIILALGAIEIAMGIGWYPFDLQSILLTVGLIACAIAFGRAVPLLTLIVIAVAVAWSGWWFDVPELRVLPLAAAGYRAASTGLRLLIALPVVAVSALLAVVPGILDMLPALLAGDIVLQEFMSDPSLRILTGALSVAAVFLGAATYRQKRSADELRRRNDELVRLRDAERERAAAETRASLARDIHDVVAHHVSAMVIRAQAAERVADARPEELRAAVHGVVEDGREALSAMRRLVRVLRTEEQSGSVGVDVGQAVAAVAARGRDAGLHIEWDVREPESLTEYGRANVVRIIEEAVTNVLLHSDADRVRITVAEEDDAVQIEVSDNGSARESLAVEQGGSGVRGMRERAAALGGRLSAGPADQGWRVVATIPLVGGMP